jgi:hypothetical protein
MSIKYVNLAEKCLLIELDDCLQTDLSACAAASDSKN